MRLGSLEPTTLGLVLAALSSLAFLAYRHPKAYARLCLWLIGAVASAMFLVLSYNSGAQNAYHALDDVIDPSKSSEALQIKRDTEFPWMGTIVVSSCAMAYLVLLAALPSLRPERDEEQEAPKDGDEAKLE